MSNWRGFPHERLHQDKSPERGIARSGDLGGFNKTRLSRIHSLIQQRRKYLSNTAIPRRLIAVFLVNTFNSVGRIVQCWISSSDRI
ncbi:hypothetical protein [Moorena producens]|uniref:hypothetical protein n=1 Tax=Moorena producens TaxID=1155739 RepID=UPI003C70EE30